MYVVLTVGLRIVDNPYIDTINRLKKTLICIYCFFSSTMEGHILKLIKQIIFLSWPCQFLMMLITFKFVPIMLCKGVTCLDISGVDLARNYILKGKAVHFNIIFGYLPPSEETEVDNSTQLQPFLVKSSCSSSSEQFCCLISFSFLR